MIISIIIGVVKRRFRRTYIKSFGIKNGNWLVVGRKKNKNGFGCLSVDYSDEDKCSSFALSNLSSYTAGSVENWSFTLPDKICGIVWGG